MSKRITLALAALASAAFIAACGGNEEAEDKAVTSSAPVAAVADPTETGAAELRAGLTALLQEHVYLAGIAITQGVGEGLDSKEFKASAATLDENSKGLADAIGGVYGDAAGEQFLALWRDHIGMFVEYTKGRALKDSKLAVKAEKDLDGYRAEFGAFLASANPNLTEEAVAEELKPHVATVIETIDSLIAKDGKVFDNLREAASHMPATANVLAGAIAKQMPDKFGA